MTNSFLVTAATVKESFDRIKESLADMTVSFEITGSTLSPIVEVLPYNPDLDVEVGRRDATEEELESGEVSQ